MRDKNTRALYVWAAGFAGALPPKTLKGAEAFVGILEGAHSAPNEPKLHVSEAKEYKKAEKEA